MVKSLYLNGEIFTPSQKLFSINLVYNINYFIFKQIKSSLMKTNEFTPEESFALIDQVIQRAKIVLKKTVSPLFYGEHLLLSVVLVKPI